MAKTIIKSVSKAAYIEIPPNPKRLIHALREMGYTSLDAILDLVDNSIDAKATRISVHIKGLERDMVIDILDNGVGMDKATLNQALRFGSETEHDSRVDLGKYGMGLNSAGISLARNIWVLTRQEKQQAWEATFDLDVIERENKFVVTLAEAPTKKVLEHIGDRGTLIRLSRIDRPGDTNVARFADNLRKRMGQVYRHFIRDGVVMSVNNRIVQAADPLMLDHELTETVLDQDIELAPGKKAHLTVVELPEFGQQGDAEVDIFPHNSGIYVVRNGRQIMDAQTFGFYRHHHSYSHFRAELAFDGSLDEDFHVDVKKGMVWPDSRMLDRLRQKMAPLVAESGKRGRDRDQKPVRVTHAAAEERIAAVFPMPAAPPAKAPEKAKPADPNKPEVKRMPDSPAPTKRVEFTQVKDTENSRFFKTLNHADGRVTIVLNTAHPFVGYVAKQPGGMSVLDAVAFALSRAEEEIQDGEKYAMSVSKWLGDMYSKKL